MTNQELYNLSIELIKKHNELDISKYSNSDIYVLIANLKMAVTVRRKLQGGL